jgi:hypothetical protein
VGIITKIALARGKRDASTVRNQKDVVNVRKRRSVNILFVVQTIMEELVSQAIQGQLDHLDLTLELLDRQEKLELLALQGILALQAQG